MTNPHRIYKDAVVDGVPEMDGWVGISFAVNGERFLVTVEPWGTETRVVWKIRVKRVLANALLAFVDVEGPDYPHPRATFEWAVDALEREGVI